VKRILTVGEEVGNAVRSVLVGPVERLEASSGREALAIHHAKAANLIAFGLDVPDMPPETFVRHIREDERLREVSLLLVCGDTQEDGLRAARCRVNEVVRPATDQVHLQAAVKRLLEVPPRTEVSALTRVSFPGPSPRPPIIFARSRNISTAGILLEARHELGKGEQVACSIALPGGGDVSATGEVVRVEEVDGEPSLYGIAWYGLSSEAQASIANFVTDARAHDLGRRDS
jgi:CheY-like chemotaxis protein